MIGLENDLDNDLLDTIRPISRYFSQISLYKREVLINISTSMENLEVFE